MCYDGAGFCGWQIQPSDPSVQEALENALGTLLRTRVQVTGAGRTDTDVSASFYVAHFDFDGPVPNPLAPNSPSASPNSLDCNQLRYKLNAILPKSISIIRIIPTAPDFHARFDAVRRQYTYYLHRSKDPFCESFSYFFAYPEVDFDAMNRAAQMLLGTHDFSCFEKSGGDNNTSVCTIFKAHWEPYTPTICSGNPACCSRDSAVIDAGQEPLYWRFTIEADRFLRNMVRAIVGTLLEVGRGRRTIQDFQILILPAQDLPANQNIVSKGPSRRSEAGESVPGHALFLSDIQY